MFPFFLDLNSHWWHWWQRIRSVVVLSITVSFTRASVVNIAIPALFSTTLPLSVSPWLFFWCLSKLDFFANIFLQTTQETVLFCVQVFSLLCNFVCLGKIFFVENVLWHKLQEFSREFDYTEFVQVLLCLTKLVFKVVLYSHKSQRNFGGLASLLAFSCTPFLCVLKLLFDEEK